MPNAMTAAGICAHLNLNKHAWALLRDPMTPREFLEALIASKQYVPGIDFVAHSLHVREAVWWGCVCLQHVTGGCLSALDRAACTAAVQWVIDPSETNRVAVKPPAEAAGAGSPAAALAAAVYQTGSDTGNPKAPAPDAFAPAKAVANAVKLACTLCEPVRMVETQRLFVELGMSRVQ